MKVNKKKSDSDILKQSLKDITGSAADSTAVDDQLLEIVAADKEKSAADSKVVRKKRSQLGASFFSSLIAALVGLHREEKEAEHLWSELLQHKYIMSQQLGRNVGIRVAAIDYFTNITEEKDISLAVVDKQTFLKTSTLAISDGLTGLYNHRYFHDRLREELQQTCEKDFLLSIAIMDIDFFKQYNDINGHVAGDVALYEVANTIKKTAKGGICCRYGGEEFALVFPHIAKQKALKIIEEVRLKIQDFSFPNEFVLPAGILTISGGIAEFPLDGTNNYSLIDYADRALYQSKRKGKNCICPIAPNRRCLPRCKINRLPVRIIVTSFDATSKEYQAEISDISVGGMRCHAHFNLEINQVVHLILPEGLFDNCSPVLSLILRCRQTDKEYWDIALRFIKLPKALEEKLEKFINEEQSR